MIANSEERILPLINIVFLLLIFFMVVGHLAPADQLVQEPLQSSAAQPYSLASEAPLPLNIQMGSGGQLALNGAVLTQDQLVKQLEAKFAAPKLPITNITGRVTLKVDGRVEAKLAIELINRLREVQVPDLRLLTLSSDVLLNSDSPVNNQHRQATEMTL